MRFPLAILRYSCYNTNAYEAKFRSQRNKLCEKIRLFFSHDRIDLG